MANSSPDTPPESPPPGPGNAGKLPDSVVELVSGILQRHAVVLDVQSLPMGVYAGSILYMTYWFHRLGDARRKEKLRASMLEYLGPGTNPSAVREFLEDPEWKERASRYVEEESVVRRTVDILVTRETPSGTQFLTVRRDLFPTGLALPGGFVREDDDRNDLDIPGDIYAALRVAGEKVLGSPAPSYGKGELLGRKYYFARSGSGQEARIYMDRTVSHRYKDHLRQITSPSDPRHVVDTVGYAVEIVGAEVVAGVWLPKEAVSAPTEPGSRFAFRHHKQIASSLFAKNFMALPEGAKEGAASGVSHHEWVRGIVKEPLDAYEGIRARFAKNGNDPNTPMPELLPVVNHFRQRLAAPDIDAKCRQNPALGHMREQVLHKFHHVTIENGDMCPYAPTLRTIFEAVAFFDALWRCEKEFSTHFQKKYWYRFEQLMRRIPEAIMIPTFDDVSATDLMKVRGVPLYFIGVSTEPMYVDEFWQSPLEFLIHDINHAWKMLDMDDRFLKAHPGWDRARLMRESCAFLKAFLPGIAISKSDSEEEREMKKLKKILLFEVGHEDGRPLLAHVVCETLLEAEGYEFPDDVVHYCADGSQAYLERRVISGITALSYVRHKLQHGFFDQTDSQNIQIVSPKYRTVEWIVRAAEELLDELGAEVPEAALRGGLREYLTRQACSRWPGIVHAPENLDPAVGTYGDGTLAAK